MTLVKAEDPMSPEAGVRYSPTSGARLCNAIRRGRLCGQPAIRGLEKCKNHAGTDLTTARLKGLANIGALVPVAIKHVAETIADPMVPEPVRLAAAKIVLDAGLDPRAVDLVAQVERKNIDALSEAIVAMLDHLGLEGQERDDALNVMRAKFAEIEIREASDDD